MKKKIYRWQPEVSVSIIYWSCTFAILFLSLILTLEHTKPYLASNIVLCIFFFFVYLGANRYFLIGSENLIIHALLPINRKEISFQSIKEIKVGKKGIKMYANSFDEQAQLFLMTKRTKEKFVEEIKKLEISEITISYDENLKMLKE